MAVPVAWVVTRALVVPVAWVVMAVPVVWAVCTGGNGGAGGAGGVGGMAGGPARSTATLANASMNALMVKSVIERVRHVRLGVDKCSPLANGECRDTCPEGTVCDPNCQGCIQDPVDCDGPDRCDGLDNDCDGAVDEDALPEGIICGEGICARDGRRRCIDGNWVDDCQPGLPIDGPDECDGRDSDCDGDADEDFAQENTVCGEGICLARGETQCLNGQVIDSCEPGAPQAGIDDCGDGDTDCDGALDEDCVQNGCRLDRATARCIDSCPDGQSCDADCGGCVDDVPPSPCTPDAATNACDDQCPDGQVCNPDCDGCVAVGVDKCTLLDDGRCLDLCPENTVCDPNCQGCVQVANNCDGPDLCDGLDNDCDGRIDEAYQGRGITCGEGICRRDGVTRCVNGAEVSVCQPGQPQDGPDICDGQDTDCDGTTDENFLLWAQFVVKASAAHRARRPAWMDVLSIAVSQGVPNRADNTCNGQDDDCDGRTDEAYQGRGIICGASVGVMA